MKSSAPTPADMNCEPVRGGGDDDRDDLYRKDLELLRQIFRSSSFGAWNTRARKVPPSKSSDHMR